MRKKIPSSLHAISFLIWKGFYIRTLPGHILKYLIQNWSIIVILFRGKGTCCITLADSGTGSEKMQTLNACSSDDHWNGSLAYKWDFLLLFMCTMYFIPNNTSITISTPKFRIKPIIPVNKRLLNRSIMNKTNVLQCSTSAPTTGPSTQGRTYSLLSVTNKPIVLI